MAIRHDEDLEGQLFAALRDRSPSRLGTILGTLLLTDADINAPNESGLTPLQAAFAWGCPDEMRVMLIESGADVAPVKDQIGWAAGSGSVKTVRKFLAAGADPNRQAGSGDGVREDVNSAFDTVFGESGRPRASRSNTTPPLIIAAREGHDDIVRLLIERGADVAARDAEGWTALDIAQQRKNTSCALALLQGGAEPIEGALLKAAASGDVRKLRQIIQCGVHLEERDARGSTAVMLAARHGHAGTITLLLGAGADPDAHDEQHRTALHIAAAGGHRKAVQALIGGGACCDPKSDSGETPLMIAVAKDSVEMFYDLLAAGADPLARDASGKGVASRIEPDSTCIRELLQAAASNVSKPSTGSAATRGQPADTTARRSKKKTTRKTLRKRRNKRTARNRKSPPNSRTRGRLARE